MYCRITVEYLGTGKAKRNRRFISEWEEMSKEEVNNLHTRMRKINELPYLRLHGRNNMTIYIPHGVLQNSIVIIEESEKPLEVAAKWHTCDAQNNPLDLQRQ